MYQVKAQKTGIGSAALKSTSCLAEGVGNGRPGAASRAVHAARRWRRRAANRHLAFPARNVRKKPP